VTGLNLIQSQPINFIKDEKNKFALENELMISLYSNHISRWLKYTPPQNILFLIFEDLITNPRQTCKDLFTFLSLDNIEINLDSGKNTSVIPKNFALHNYLLKFNRSVGRGISLRKVKNLYKKYFLTNKVTFDRNESQSLAKLGDYFAEDIKRCEQLLSLDLDHWK